MLSGIPSLQGQNQQQGLVQHQQGQQAQQQAQQNQNQNQVPQQSQPPPLNGQDLNLSVILHYLQTEWRRYERERNEWEIERAEMRARIALLEGERRSFENTRIDLLRRIKMLEFALRMERSKQLNQSANPSSANDKVSRDDNGYRKEGSSSSSPRSEEIPLPPENRLSLPSYGTLPNGGPIPNQKDRPHTWAGANWQGSTSGVVQLGKAAPGRDPKSRARSRDYLKQCLQEISYLTSPQAMNPLPNRPLLSNPALPLTLPNVPPFDQMAYNGRPRKIVPEVGKDFPSLNGIPLLPQTLPTAGSPMPLMDRENRQLAPQGMSMYSSQGQLGQSNVPSANFQQQQQQQMSQQQQARQQEMQQQPSLSIQMPQQPQQPAPLPSTVDSKDTTSEESEPQLQTAIFRPGREWKEELERARMEKVSQSAPVSGASAWETSPKEEEDEDMRTEEQEVDEDDTTSTTSDDDGKLWRPRRTLRNHLDSVRTIAFHPTELCLASGGDDFCVKVWRMDASAFSASASRSATMTDIEPQLTLRGHNAPVTALVHSPTKRLVYSASLDSSIRVWALPPSTHTTYAPFDNHRAKGALIGHSAAVWGLALLKNETILVSCSADGAVYVWDVSGPLGSGQLKLKWGYNGIDAMEEDGKSTRSPGASVLEAVKSDLKRIAVGYQNGAIKVFDVNNGALVVTLETESEHPEGGSQQVNAITSHPTMPTLVSGHEDRCIRIWDMVTGLCTHSMLAHLDAVTSLSIDAAGFSLASGGHDCSLRFWDLINSRACIQEVSSHREKSEEGVLAVDFHSSLPFIASAGADGVIKLYASS